MTRSAALKSYPISDDERMKRAMAVQRALGNNAIEGVFCTQAEKAEFQRYIDGEIELSDIIKSALKPALQSA